MLLNAQFSTGGRVRKISEEKKKISHEANRSKKQKERKEKEKEKTCKVTRQELQKRGKGTIEERTETRAQKGEHINETGG